MMLAQLGNRIRVAGVDAAKEFFGLTTNLLQIGPNGQAADGHDDLLQMSPWSAGNGQRRFGDPNVWRSAQVDSVLSADGRRPVRPASSYHRAARHTKMKRREHACLASLRATCALILSSG
jgi:hypothetical protein